ncbi:hypothetical protein BpHYR1_025398 [Brachionus plicatilis]|uniref:Uncharacterized protein n=1 Tax=Brachionus plicatilis TaxID=10195 RepID=A0A3M7RH45_BRAPC|nr:hypothetical protein BpHYR1_025398 [Brachionus plicatilis]
MAGQILEDRVVAGKLKSPMIKLSFLKPFKISMILAAKHRKKSHFDSFLLLIKKIEKIRLTSRYSQFKALLLYPNLCNTHYIPQLKCINQ